MCVWVCVWCSERLYKRRSGKETPPKKRFACSNVIAGLWSRLWFSCWSYKIFPNPSEIVSQEVKVQHWKCAQVCAYDLLTALQLTAVRFIWSVLLFFDARFAECGRLEQNLITSQEAFQSIYQIKLVCLVTFNASARYHQESQSAHCGTTTTTVMILDRMSDHSGWEDWAPSCLCRCWGSITVWLVEAVGSKHLPEGDKAGAGWGVLVSDPRRENILDTLKKKKQFCVIWKLPKALKQMIWTWSFAFSSPLKS